MGIVPQEEGVQTLKASGNRHERRAHEAMKRRHAKRFLRLQRGLAALRAQLTKPRKPGQPKRPSRRSIRAKAEALLAEFEGRR